MSELEQVLSVDLDGKLKQQIKVDTSDTEATDQLQNLYCSLRTVIDPKKAELKILEQELAEVEESLQKAIDAEAKPHEDGVRKTDEWMLSYAARGNQTTITDKKKLIEILGLEAYLTMSTISITDMRKYLTQAQVDQVSKTERKSKRTLKYAKVG